MEHRSCDWAGCGKLGEATLEGRWLCRDHFHEGGSKQLVQFGKNLQQIESSETLTTATLKVLSELISQATALAIQAKFLRPFQRDQLQAMSMSASELYKRIQRSPRTPLKMPIIIHRGPESIGGPELAHTVNVSKRGACIATSTACLTDENIWIQKVDSPMRVATRVTWSQKAGPHQFLAGIAILDYDDFWMLNSGTRR